MTDRERTYLQTPQQWTRFLSAFTHELRTPLASLRMLGDLLAETDGRLGDQEKRYAANIQAVAQDIHTLIGEVAELGSLLAGKVQVRHGEVDLPQLVERVEEGVRTRAWEAGIALTDSLDPALPRLFRTDANLLQQALASLLGAVVSQARSEIFFRLDGDSENLRVAISSDGPPFSEAALQNLFEPFGDGARATRRRGGRSLVLPLANELTRVLGGTLDAGNRGGRPTFDLWLPAGS
jgi:signal transduction histidine kinase